LKSDSIFANRSAWLTGCIALLIIASLSPRFYALGDTSFQGDEEYTAFAASAVIEGKAASLPSGVPYRRAVPLTYLSAASAALLGTDKETSFRLPVTLLGVFTPLFIFLLLRPLLGGSAAFIAALLLAVSEWHILISRDARMYAPFLLFFTCSAICIWRWGETNRRNFLVAGIMLYAVSMTLHLLSLLATMFIFLPFVTNNRPLVQPTRAFLLFALLLIPTYLYREYYVNAGFEIFGELAPPLEMPGDPASPATVSAKLPVGYSILTLTLAIIGATIGYWLASARKLNSKQLDMTWLGIFAYYSLAILTGAFAFAGLIYAAGLIGILFFTIRTGLPPVNLKAICAPLGLLLIAMILWILFAIANLGIHDGIKSLASFPFPYLAYFFVISPGITLLFLLTCCLAILYDNIMSKPLRLSVFATIVPVLLIGMAREWGGARYLISAYPFLIISATLGLIAILDLIGSKSGWWGRRGTVVIAAVIALSGIMGGHGLPDAIRAATLGYGHPGYWPALGYPSQPDHKSAGQFVSRRLHATDIVVAEDASMQKWYSGKVDFWLRKYADASQYLYRAEDGSLRDVYVNSRIVTASDIEMFNSTASRDRRIWIITSGETSENRTYFLGDQQLHWLDHIERTQQPLHVGRDGVSKVYCLGCD